MDEIEPIRIAKLPKGYLLTMERFHRLVEEWTGMVMFNQIDNLLIPKEERMKVYIGTKIIQAEPMTDKVFTFYQGKDWLQLTPERPGYKVVYPDGYTSWSPKDVFDNSYREVLWSEYVHISKCADEACAKDGVVNMYGPPYQSISTDDITTGWLNPVFCTDCVHMQNDVKVQLGDQKFYGSGCACKEAPYTDFVTKRKELKDLNPEGKCLFFKKDQREG